MTTDEMTLTPSTTQQFHQNNGLLSIQRQVASLAARLPRDLEPLAYIAYNYAWSWSRTGRRLFASVDPERWLACGENPVRLLHDVSGDKLGAAARNEQLVADAHALLSQLEHHREEDAVPIGDATPSHPIAFLCAEFAIHSSMQIYAGGLGVLAGDILKASSDARFPVVGVGLLYREGYFHQRMDKSGWQHEYWVPLDPERTPAVLVTDPEGSPITVSVPLRGRDVVVQIWRVDVGRVPLFLLDAQRPENSLQDRWVTSQLYVGDKAVRLAQYALLGVGAVRALRVMGLEPSILHLNEGHAALAPLELAQGLRGEGESLESALSSIRNRVVFTTHTPVAAGNEGYSTDEIAEVLGDYPATLGIDISNFLQMGRTNPDMEHEPFVMTPLGIRVAHLSNAVSERHGQVAREMWHPLFPDSSVEDVPIGHVTNGVHLPTWMALPMRQLMDQHLAQGWEQRAADPETWAPLQDIPNAALWEARQQLRTEMFEKLRHKIVTDRLSRNEGKARVSQALTGFQSDKLTVGFARRMAAYKRIQLLVSDPDRFVHLLDQGMQLLVSGKAHPQDDDGKKGVQNLFGLKGDELIGRQLAFLDDYDLAIASHLVSGCDAWINVPRPPLEASGTSGMKVVMNGGLNISILDGWWCEGFDGTNGWSLGADITYDQQVQDERDAQFLYDTFERQVIPLFYDRDASGVPSRWMEMVKRSMLTLIPRFCASRMIADYARLGYAQV